MDELVQSLRQILGHDAVLSEPAELLVYECDGLPQHKFLPRAVIFPRSTEQVSAAIKVLVKANVPFAPRGAGTGLSGGALARERGVIIEMARMKRLLNVDAENACARVETGVVNAHLSRAVAPLNLYYVPDPSSQATCTIGGNLAENAGGIHCLKYGMTVDHVISARVVLADGEIVELTHPSSGYDLLGLFIGSEGTFGIATEATLKLTPIPPAVRTLLADFIDINEASRAVSEIIAEGFVPAALEMMDGATIRAVEASVFAAGVPIDAEAALLIELDGLVAGLDEEAGRVATLCQKHGARSVRIASKEYERKKLWAARKGAFGAMGRISPDIMLQDAVVPRSRLPEILARIYGIAAHYQLTLANVFHAGDGNLHPYICYDSRFPDQVKRVKEAGREMMEICVNAGGTITGEHGVGLDKSEYLPLIFSPDDLDVMFRVRNAFDPIGLCNPGKVLPTPRTCSEARPYTSTSLPNLKSEISNLKLNKSYRVEPLIPVSALQTERVFSQLSGLLPDKIIPGQAAPHTVTPQTVEELCEVMRMAQAERWSVLPVGAGSWAQVGNPRVVPDLIMETGGLAGLTMHEPADLVASAQAGMTLRDLNDALGRAGQWLPLDPPDDGRSTIGGVAATGLSGAQSLGYGAPRSHIIGMQVMLADGRLIKAGGRVVKNVAGYDLCKLFTGSYGTLGIITNLTFKLRPRPLQDATMILRSESLMNLIEAGQAVLKRQLLPVAVELLSARAIDRVMAEDVRQKHGLLIRFAGSPETVAAQLKETASIVAAGSSVTSEAQMDDKEIWSRLAALPFSNLDHLNIRLHAAPTQVPSLLMLMEENFNRLPGGLVWQAGLGDGRVRLMIDRDSSGQDISKALLRLRQQAQEKHRTLLVVEDASAKLKEEIGVWGQRPDTLPLMGRLKEQLDPGQILNPRCFDF